MIFRSSFPVIFLALFGLVVLPGSASATLQEVTEALYDSSQQRVDALDTSIDALVKKIQDTADKIGSNFITLSLDDARKNGSAVVYELLGAVKAFPNGTQMQDEIFDITMESRRKELHRIALNKPPFVKPQYLVDTTWPDINIQQYDIWMRYFCDPQSNSGRMADAKRVLDAIPNSTGYTLGCGYVDGNAAIQTRHSVLGKDDTTDEAKQIIGLPSRPGDLLFSTKTFPTMPSTSGAKITNTNKMADVYYGAFALSVQFLLGSAPEDGSNIEGQARIARQTLATYPLAMLFSERLGSMGPDAAQSLATTLRIRLNPGQNDPNNQRIEMLLKQKTVSVAEYMDIVMNQIPMSPGYYARINNELSPQELRREEVWLSAMQTALNYQRNRWLEIQAAIEAVR